MKTKLHVNFFIDKLEVVYELPAYFETALTKVFIPTPPKNASPGSSKELWNLNPVTTPLPKVFILTREVRNQGPYPFKSPDFLLFCLEDGPEQFIGSIKTHLEHAWVLRIDNRFLYSDELHLIREFESAFDLDFKRIKSLDLCCDSNHNLPKKFDDMLHQRNCSVTRPGRKKDKLALTESGNQKLGIKVVPNLKVLTEYERGEPSYYYFLTNSGGKKPMVLRGYNKLSEISEKSNKNYIAEKNGFKNNIHRLEISLTSYDITYQSKNKKGWSHTYIYEKLENQGFIRTFFIELLNRFFKLKKDGKSISISKFLRLE